MNTPSSSRDQALHDIAERHGFSTEAARSMLDALIAGRGSMAQFAHPEFGGSGQWMRGGMTMVSNLFDDSLRSRVDALCRDLAALAESQGDRAGTASAQSQRQSSGEGSSRGPFASSSADHWWPAGLGSPDSTGSQNRARYAWFAQAARLAIEVDGRVTVYDTQDHRIGGFSQAQSSGSSMGFHSQHGEVDVERLPVVSRSEGDRNDGGHPPAAAAVPPTSRPSPDDGDVYAHIEKLAALHAKGALTDDEFRDKKADLLGRI